VLEEYRVETADTVVNAIEEPASGATVVTDAEAAELREPRADPEQPAEDQN
jgi:hypothetical protein